MKKQAAYLHERNYTETGQEGRLSRKRIQYWERILGGDVLKLLIDQNGPCFRHLCGIDYTADEQGMGDLERYLREEAVYGAYEMLAEETDRELFFAKFYAPLCTYAALRLKERLGDAADYIADKVWESFWLQTAAQLQSICLRTLIVEMHTYKEKGRLKLGTPEQEYQYFCEACVTDRSFFLHIMDTYPALLRCIEERIDSFVDFYAEVIGHFEKDKAQIGELFSLAGEINMILDIQGVSSDLHNHGKQVLRITLNHGLEILYKPHAMDNEGSYMRLLEWISGKTGIGQYRYPFLSYAGHSWCKIVSYESCRTEDKLHRYYRRLGSQLFLIYLLGTKDLHSENVIAHGEYPVLIDLETLVNIQYNQKRDTVFQEICYQLTNSVLYTGLLPFYYFNHGGEGVNSSAISGVEGQRYPFKIPAVVHPKTSDMKIAYRYPVSKSEQNLALLKGEFVPPSGFGRDLISGFRDTYLAVVENRDMFREELVRLADSASRYLIQETQRYSMLLSTSYHPGFLMDGAERELFLYSLRKGRMKERPEVIDCEREALLKGDIPYFYYNLNDTALLMPGGSGIPSYFEKAPADIVFEKLDTLDGEDMERQCEYIKMSLDLMPDSAEKFVNRCYKAEKNTCSDKSRNNSRRISETIQNLTERLLKYAVWNHEHTEVSWFTVQLSAFGKPSWEIKPMNMYLYDGLAGMLLIFYELRKRDEAIGVYYDTIRRMLFEYTDFMCGETGKHMIRDTGMYEGEASILYAYYLLYENGGGEVYLAYAVRHAAVVERLLAYDQRYDLLTGNAGAALALVYLYEAAGDERYLRSAERAMEVLEKNAVRMERGTGWIIETGFPPFAGMAHGNSGILMAAAALWQHTGSGKYRLLMEQLLDYEDSLFDERLQNWKDMRGSLPGDEHGALAWCHGAGGILLSRVFCYERLEDAGLRKRLEKDILMAYRKLAGYWKRDSWSLCHGSCGNAWILKLAGKALGQPAGEAGMPEILTDREQISLLPQEKLNPGLMNGYGGMLLYLLSFNRLL